MKRILCICVTVALVFALTACGSSAPSSSGTTNQPAPKTPATQLRIGTASTTGAFYPIGGMMATVLSEEIDGYNFTSEANGGSMENVRLVDQRQIAMGFCGSHVMYYAYSGTEDFEKEGKKDILSMANLYTTPVQFVSLKSKNIKSMADLVGKKITIGTPGSTGNSTARVLLGCFDLVDGKNCTFIAIEPGEACQGLKDGTVDCALIAVGYPTAAIQELSLTHEISILNMSDEDVATVNKRCKFLTKMVLPGGTYKAVENDTVLMGQGNELVVNPDLPNDLVYQMCKVMFDTRFDDVKSSHACMKTVAPEMLPMTAIPLHPGAEKYYKEIGVLK